MNTSNLSKKIAQYNRSRDLESKNITNNQAKIDIVNFQKTALVTNIETIQTTLKERSISFAPFTSSQQSTSPRAKSQTQEDPFYLENRDLINYEWHTLTPHQGKSLSELQTLQFNLSKTLLSLQQEVKELSLYHTTLNTYLTSQNECSTTSPTQAQ